MKRFLVLLFMLLLCLVLPGTLFHYLSWGGIKPDLAMLWVIYIALHYRPVEGMVHSFIIGFIIDCYLGRYIGLYAIVLTVVALMTSFLQKRWYKENIPLTMVFVFFLTALGHILMVLIVNTAGLQWSLGTAIRVISGTAFYNCLLVPLTYPFLHRSFTRGLLYHKPEYEQE